MAHQNEEEHVSNWPSHEWNVYEEFKQCKKEISQMKMTNKVESDPFCIGDLMWKLVMYPNGRTEEGFVNIYLDVLHLPKTWKEMMTAFRINFKHNDATRTFICTYKEGSKSFGWPSSSPVISNQEFMKLLNANRDDKQMIFTVSINIIRVRLDNDNILFQNEMDYDNKRVAKLKWTLTKSHFDRLRNDKDLKYANDYESRIFDGLWCLMCKKKKDKFVGVYLILCGLPPNVSEIDAMFTLKCAEKHKKNTLQKRFKAKGQSWGLSEFLCFDDFKKYAKITLTADVRILNEVDLCGNDVKDSELQKKYDVNSMEIGKKKNFVPGIEGEGSYTNWNGNDAALKEKMSAMEVRLEELNKQLMKEKKGKDGKKKRNDCLIM